VSVEERMQPIRRGRPGYDREALLAVAVDVFNERGYDGTSMEDLARTLGITKSAIYHHVRSKQELLGLALDRALDGLQAAAAEAVAMPAPAVERLEHLLRASVLVLVERLPFVTLLLRVRGNTDVERAALTRRRDLDRVAADLAAEAVAQRDLRPDVDAHVLARLLFGLVNSLVEWYRPTGGSDGGLDASALADAVCAVAFDGLRLGGEAPSPPPGRATRGRRAMRSGLSGARDGEGRP
jgi:AcrR family transcriptional regulator